MIHYLRELTKASPDPAVNERFYWNQTQEVCAIFYLWIAYVEAAQFVLSLSLGGIIYLAIVKKVVISFKTNIRHKLIVIGSLLIYPVVYTIIMGYVASIDGYLLQGTSCTPISNAPSIIAICQCFAAVVILVVLIGNSLRYIWQVVRDAYNMNDSSLNKRAWITVRFLLIIFLQAAPRIAVNTYYLILTLHSSVSNSETNSAAWEGTVIPLVCYWLNALVVFWGNKSFHKWCLGKFIYLHGSLASSSWGASSSVTLKQSVELEQVNSEHK